jgi:regulator of nucleoside diphosphate kinase
MNHPLPCRLTTKDHAILETLLERCPEPNGAYAALLASKLAGAGVWLSRDIPAGVVTLNSRVLYRVDGGPTETRIVAQSPAGGPVVGLLLPLTTLRGLALLGLAEGESITFAEGEAEVTLSVQAVAYQPEAARREAQLSRAEARSPVLRLVHSTSDLPEPEPAQPSRYVLSHGFDDDNDPGPSAA